MYMFRLPCGWIGFKARRNKGRSQLRGESRTQRNIVFTSKKRSRRFSSLCIFLFKRIEAQRTYQCRDGDIFFFLIAEWILFTGAYHNIFYNLFHIFQIFRFPSRPTQPDCFYPLQDFPQQINSINKPERNNILDSL